MNLDQSERSLYAVFGSRQTHHISLPVRGDLNEQRIEAIFDQIMGKRKIHRADRKRKRGFFGNRYTQKQGEDKSDSEQESVDGECTASVEQQADDSDVNKPARDTTASASKLGKGHFLDQQEQVSFDRDEKLTGFRFIDTELLVDFIQSLLCPNCRKPLGQNRRNARVTEERLVLASTFVFHCQCQHSVTLNTSRKCGKTYEVSRRFPLSMFSIGKKKIETCDKVFRLDEHAVHIQQRSLVPTQRQNNKSYRNCRHKQ